MKSRYDIIPKSDQITVTGAAYPDICRLPIDQFVPRVAVKQYRLTQMDLDRFDRTVFIEYGSAEYDDIVLWFNNAQNIHELAVGDIINFPDVSDLQRFMRDFRQGIGAM